MSAIQNESGSDSDRYDNSNEIAMTIQMKTSKNIKRKHYKHGSLQLYHKSQSCDALSCTLLGLPRYNVDEKKFEVKPFRVVEVRNL